MNDKTELDMDETKADGRCEKCGAVVAMNCSIEGCPNRPARKPEAPDPTEIELIELRFPGKTLCPKCLGKTSDVACDQCVYGLIDKPEAPETEAGER